MAASAARRQHVAGAIGHLARRGRHRARDDATFAQSVLPGRGARRAGRAAARGRRGLAFIFTVDWHQLGNYSIWLEALTQNAWDTGSGWGLITVYAIYVRPKDDSSVNCFLLGIGNNVASLLSGVAVLCTVFAIMPEAEKQIVGAGNYGLTFVWFPQLFARMPAGGLFMIIFFAALFMAAFMSLISMVELAVRGLQDLGMTRDRSLVIAGGLGLLGGVPSALSLDFSGQSGLGVGQRLDSQRPDVRLRGD